MLSQLTKTIKLALKSSQEERAILRARSAVQRFPVVEWRQRLEDFQRRSINISRSNAGEHAWCYDVADQGVGGGGGAGFYSQQDNGSNLSLARDPYGGESPSSSAPPSPLPRHSQLGGHSPLAEGNGQLNNGYYENNGNLAVGHNYHDRFANDGGGGGGGGAPNRKSQNRTSADSFYDEDPNASPLYYQDKRKSGRKFFAAGGHDDDEMASSMGSSDHGDTTVVGSSHSQRDPAAQTYDNFLAAANRQFAKTTGGRNAPDPYFDNRNSMDAPSRPFSIHSRVSSFDSISSIVDEKGASSPLNKAMDSFTDSDGEVAQSFVQKLRDLSSDNSKGDLCIEKFLIKSEKAFFDEIKKDKMTAQSMRSSRDSYMHSRAPSMIDGFRPECERGFFTGRTQSADPSSAPYSMSGHGHDGEPDHYGGNDMYGDEPPSHDKPMTRLQILMQRTIFGWPLYTIVISLGQLLSAVSPINLFLTHAARLLIPPDLVPAQSARWL